MKVEINEQPDLIYPKLMKSDFGSIVLFTERNHGIFIHHYSDENMIGIPLRIDNMNKAYKPFNGKITLSNK